MKKWLDSIIRLASDWRKNVFFRQSKTVGNHFPTVYKSFIHYSDSTANMIVTINPAAITT